MDYQAVLDTPDLMTNCVMLQIASFQHFKEDLDFSSEQLRRIKSVCDSKVMFMYYFRFSLQPTFLHQNCSSDYIPLTEEEIRRKIRAQMEKEMGDACEPSKDPLTVSAAVGDDHGSCEELIASSPVSKDDGDDVVVDHNISEDNAELCDATDGSSGAVCEVRTKRRRRSGPKRRSLKKQQITTLADELSCGIERGYYARDDRDWHDAGIAVPTPQQLSGILNTVVSETDVMVFAPPCSGKSTLNKSLGGLFCDTDHLSRWNSPSNKYVITNMSHVGVRAKRKVAVIPSRAVFERRCQSRGLDPQASWYDDLIASTVDWEVIHSDDYLSEALAEWLRGEGLF